MATQFNTSGGVSGTISSFMEAFDALPPELREWVRTRQTCYAANRVQDNWEAARAHGLSMNEFLEWMDREHERLEARDTLKTYGPEHPSALQRRREIRDLYD